MFRDLGPPAASGAGRRDRAAGPVGLRRLSRRCGRTVRCRGRAGRSVRDRLLRRGRTRIRGRSRRLRGGRGHRLLRSGNGLRHMQRREQRQRIDVALLLRRRADAEVQEGRLVTPGRTRRRNLLPLAHSRSPRDGERAEVQQRGAVPRCGLDRERLAAVRHGPGKRHDAVGRSANGCPGRDLDIDAPVLPGRIRTGGVERERAQNRPVDGPGPRVRGSRQGERAQKQDGESAQLVNLLSCQL